jgi:non-lysosomal glucosylceramidase
MAIEFPQTPKLNHSIKYPRHCNYRVEFTLKFVLLYRSILIGLLLFALLIRVALAQSITDPSHFVPLKKDLSSQWWNDLWKNGQRIYKGKELLTIGMPCGGIAAGQLYVRGDGSLANWWIANNAYNTGYGISHLLNFNTALGPWKVCYQTFEPMSYIDQGFSITIKSKKESVARKLNKTDFDDISFIGEYPIASIKYASVSNPLPVEIQTDIFSPFIPLDAKESATPGTIIKYHLKNISKKPVTITLTGWLQNPVCLEIKDEICANSRNRVMREKGITSVVLDLVRRPESCVKENSMAETFDDFETGDFKNWKSTGTAFGLKPVEKTLPDQQPVNGYQGRFYVNSYHNGDSSTGKLTSFPFTIKQSYVNFIIGGGDQKGKTCINLLVNNEIVRTETGSNSEEMEYKSWDVRELKGKQAHFEIVDDAEGEWGHISVDQLMFSNYPDIKEKYFPEMHPYFGNVALSLLSENSFADTDYVDVSDHVPSLSAEKSAGEKLVGSVGTSISMKPGESKELVFLLTWYFPNRPMDYGDGGNWNKKIPTGGSIIGNMYSNWYNSSSDVATWLCKNLDRLSSETYAFHKSYYENTSLPYWLKQRIMMPVSTLATETCQWWATDKFWAWEGVGSCVGTCTHVWNYEQALARLFPDLERNIREKTDFGTSFRDDGAIYARNGWGDILIDGHAGAILKAYREDLISKDNIFLSRNWNKIKKATEYLIKEDENEDGLIEKKQSNTYDIAFFGANTYVGGLYLSALKAASEMARIMNDTSFSSKCTRIFESGKRLTVEKLWNGEYFIQDVDLTKHPKFQYATGCLSDQLFGQTWAHLNNLGYIYPRDKVKTALESVWKYNWTPDVEVQNKNHPPERIYADPGEAGLLICTWPKSKHMSEDGVRYRDEVWTGIEYQVATNMIYEGMIDEGLSIIKAVHERYSPEKHNPWNEIECGDHYARALASWGVLIALEDFFYDGPEKSIKFAPKVQQSNFDGFFTAAEGWGNIEQTRNDKSQINTLSVTYGNVHLKSITVELLKKPDKVQLFIGADELPCSFNLKNNSLIVEFEEQNIQTNNPLKLVIGLSDQNSL